MSFFIFIYELFIIVFSLKLIFIRKFEAHIVEVPFVMGLS